MPCKQEVAEHLGAKISELCSYIYAAEHRLLTLIREFYEQEGWADFQRSNATLQL